MRGSLMQLNKRTNLLSSERFLSESFNLALLDLDGVVYRGGNAVANASDAIANAQKRGMFIEYTTNNSSRFPTVVAKQLESFGLKVEPWQIITSSVVAARMVARHVDRGAKVLVLGAEHLLQEVKKVGLEPVLSCEDSPQAVIQGWYPQMTWLEMAEVSFAIEHGAKYFVTNRDLTIPRELGIAPGCGSMIQAVINATGVEPIASAGKPESAMYDEARLLVAANANSNDLTSRQDSCDYTEKDECDNPVISISNSLAVGDRLDTDIEAGTRGGYKSLLVLTGVTNPKMLMLAPDYLRPSFVSADLRGLNESHEAPKRIDENTFVCANARARLVDNHLIEVSDSSDCNALRAACALTWSLKDSGENLDDYILPEFCL